MVVESVREDRALKIAILARIERAAPRALLATNTSGLPVGGLAKALADPSRFLGLHFFSPAERMPLVEVVRGPETSTATVETALRVVRSIGKSPVIVRDGPGFFATRVFAAYLDEAVAMASEGVAVESIEAAAVANGRALGPLATLDETGIALNLGAGAAGARRWARNALLPPSRRTDARLSRGFRPCRPTELAEASSTGRRPAHGVRGRASLKPSRSQPASRIRSPFASVSFSLRLLKRCDAWRKASSPAPTTQIVHPCSGWLSRSASGAFCGGRKTSASSRLSRLAMVWLRRMEFASCRRPGYAPSDLAARDLIHIGEGSNRRDGTSFGHAHRGNGRHRPRSIRRGAARRSRRGRSPHRPHPSSGGHPRRPPDSISTTATNARSRSI